MNWQKRKTTRIGILLLLISILISGCLNLADDIVPPQDIKPTELIVQTPDSTPTAIPTETTADDPGPADVFKGEILVEVIDHSGGNLLDQDLNVHLEGYDEFERVFEEFNSLPAESFVIFHDVPLLEGRVFFASVSFGGAIYRSNLIQISQDSPDLVLQVEIFDTTTDDSGLAIDRIHVLIDFPGPDLLQISEIYILSNYGDATVVAEEQGQPVVTFPLPDGAKNIEFDNGVLGQRFIKTADGFGDTVSIPPGSGVYQILVYYNLLYAKEKLDFSQSMNYPVSAVVAMTPANQVKIKGNFLENLGVQTIPSGEVQVYSGEGIGKGETLEFSISGKPDSLTDNPVSAFDDVNVYVIGLGILGIGFILAGILVYIRNRKNNTENQIESSPTDEEDLILDTIIALEDLYNEGEISDKDYQKKRDFLKRKLNDHVQKD